MQAVAGWLKQAILASGLVACLATPAAASFIRSADFEQAAWAQLAFAHQTRAEKELSAVGNWQGKTPWWPWENGERKPVLVLGKAPAVPGGQCGSPSQVGGSSGPGWLVAISTANSDTDPVLISRLAIAEGKLSRLPPVPLELLRPS